MVRPACWVLPAIDDVLALAPGADGSLWAGTRFGLAQFVAKSGARYKLMTLDADEFIRRFLIHILPEGFHRIRHYGLFANCAFRSIVITDSGAR